MAEEDLTRFNIRTSDGECHCPACGFPGYFSGSSYDENGPQIGTGICPCCLWEPGYDDVPAARGGPDTIVEALREFRRAWTKGPAWMGKPERIPPGWNGEAQFERLLAIAPWLN